MPISLDKLLNLLLGECYARKNTIFVIFTFISMIFLIVGIILPKKYTSYSIIRVDETNILQPLMRGAAEATQPVNHAANASEIIFGEIIMNQILSDAGWLKSSPTDIEKERIKNNIKLNINISNIGENLLKVEYTDDKPMRAYVTTKRLVELFIEEGEKSKVEESQSAYEFINKQVNEYLEKLTTVEEELRAFRSTNPDARPGMENEVSRRISQLQQEIEQTQLQLQEEMIKRDTVQDQLSGEAAITISQSREANLRVKITEAQEQLETLRLDYQETYPDIVRLKHQIEDMKSTLTEEIAKRELAKKMSTQSRGGPVDDAVTMNPLYQQLRSNLSVTETSIATLNARINELRKILEAEYMRAKKFYGGEATLAQLTRNYEINQQIYQDLLRRLENARVSKNLDEEQKGLTFKIQEPANMPLIPTGVRFSHFIMAGLILGIAIPVGLIYMLLQLDSRVRLSQVLSSDMGLVVLAEIPKYENQSERAKDKLSLIFISAGILLILIIYSYVIWLKVQGEL